MKVKLCLYRNTDDFVDAEIDPSKVSVIAGPISSRGENLAPRHIVVVDGHQFFLLTEGLDVDFIKEEMQ